jgi:hypothetical protein
MNDETDNAEGKDIPASTPIPNTLAWAAHAYQKIDEQGLPLWRIRPDVLMKPAPRLGPAVRQGEKLSNADGSTIRRRKVKP